MPGADTPILRLVELGVSFPGALQPAVGALSIEIAAGECLGIVGESGSGKSLAFLAALGLAPANARITGRALFHETDLLRATPRARRALRGSKIAMVFQDPMSSLTPHLTIGTQLTETLRAHGCRDRGAARERAAALLAQVRLAEPRARLAQYPWQLSGGMRQRVMIAMALAGEPELLIADEPTTALDVTTQASVLGLLLELKRSRGLALALISHDFGVIAGLADRVVVMRAGSAIETGEVRALLASPREPYTRTLLEDAHRLEGDTAASIDVGGAGPALVVRDLTVRFERRPTWRIAARRATDSPALDAVSIDVPAGSSFGVLGESGSGKSTLVRAILRLVAVQRGTVVWMGRDVGALSQADLRRFRAEGQLVFQDPFGSLDPAMRVADLIAEPLRIHGRATGEAEGERVARAMDEVQLDRSLLARFPSELSGGQCQRVGIARALVLEPALLICDEPLSALDASVQAQIVALLRDIAHGRQRTMILVSHHVGIVRALCARTMVLYHGRVMEAGPTAELCADPHHPYTRMLLDAIPIADPDAQRARLLAGVAADRVGEDQAGSSPQAAIPAAGCSFRARCPHAIERCARETPLPEPAGRDRKVACLRVRELNTVRESGRHAILDP